MVIFGISPSSTGKEGIYHSQQTAEICLIKTEKRGAGARLKKKLHFEPGRGDWWTTPFSTPGVLVIRTLG
jgi:hypothetical protein